MTWLRWSRLSPHSLSVCLRWKLFSSSSFFVVSTRADRYVLSSSKVCLSVASWSSVLLKAMSACSSLENSGLILSNCLIRWHSLIQSSTRLRLNPEVGGVTPSSSNMAAIIALIVSIFPSLECTALASFSIWRMCLDDSHKLNSLA